MVLHPLRTGRVGLKSPLPYLYCMKHLSIIFVLAATPTWAWEFSTTPLCTVSHAGADMMVEMTYDPGLPEYALTLTLDRGSWPDGAVFSLRFEGASGLTISTTQHVIDGARLTVRDSGFGNVLNGLQFNSTAVAIIGSSEVAVSLEDAAPSIEAFRDCDLPVA